MSWHLGDGGLNREVGELLEKVYPLQNPENCRKKFVKRRRRNMLFAAVVFLLLAAAFWVGADDGRAGIMEGKIERPESGIRQVDLVARCGRYEKKIRWELSARRRSLREAVELLMHVGELLPERIRGRNESLGRVTENLTLVEALPEYNIDISWKSSDREVLGGDGSVHNKELTAKRTVVLTARLCYGEFAEEFQYGITVLPYPYTEEELLEKRLYEELRSCEEKTEGEDFLLLPETVAGEEIIWSGEKQNMTGILLLLGVAAVFVAYQREASVLRKKKKEREEELFVDYPEFLSRFILLLGAGMTVRGAWERMLSDYKKSARRRYVYEEMQRTMAQLEVGMPELRAYEQFGSRCALLSYLRFATILTQNLKKGSSGIAQLLRMEAQEAFSERKNQARRKGEEAGTKLLLPMGGMLIIVFVLILVPAFASFSL